MRSLFNAFVLCASVCLCLVFAGSTMAILPKASCNENNHIGKNIWRTFVPSGLHTNFARNSDQGRNILQPAIKSKANGDIVFISKDHILYRYNSQGTKLAEKNVPVLINQFTNSILESMLLLFKKTLHGVVSIDFNYKKNLFPENVVLHEFNDSVTLIGSKHCITAYDPINRLLWKKKEPGMIDSKNYQFALMLSVFEDFSRLKAMNSRGQVKWSIKEKGILDRIWCENDELYAYFTHDNKGSLVRIDKDFNKQYLFSENDTPDSKLEASYNDFALFFSLNKRGTKIPNSLTGGETEIQGVVNYDPSSFYLFPQIRTIAYQGGVLVHANQIAFGKLNEKVQTIINADEEIYLNTKFNFYTTPTFPFKANSFLQFFEWNNQIKWRYSDFNDQEVIEDIRVFPPIDRVLILSQFVDHNSTLNTRVQALDLNGNQIWQQIIVHRGINSFSLLSYGQGFIVHAFSENQVILLINSVVDDKQQYELIGINNENGEVSLTMTLDENSVIVNDYGTSSYILVNEQQKQIVLVTSDKRREFYNVFTVLRKPSFPLPGT